MKREKNISLEEHLRSIDSSIQPVTDDFFYTRLKGRMQQKHEFVVPFFTKPAFAISSLLLMLLVNIIVLNKQQSTDTPKNQSQIELFGKEYDLFISTPY